MKNAPLIIASLFYLFLASCGTNEKKTWSDEYKKQYMSGCISSAKKSYEARGQEADKETIENQCICVGKHMEKKYSMKEANKLTNDQMIKEVTEAIANCK